MIDRVPHTIMDDEDLTELTLSGISCDDRVTLTYSSRGFDFRLPPSAVMREFITPRHAPVRTELVRQGRYECAAASLAMLTGHTLFNVKRMMGQHGWCNDHRGAGDEVMRAAVREFGVDLVRGGRRTIRVIGSSMPPCCVTVRSLNVENMAHGVTWINGEIVDPNFGDPKRRYWGAEWAPWTMDASSVLILTRRVLSDREHEEIEETRDRGSQEEVRSAIMSVAG